MEPIKQYHPLMHTAEHILNQTMMRMFGCNRSFNNHIEKKKSKCDYYFDHLLSDSGIREIETNVNRVIQANLPVMEDFMNKVEALSIFNLDKLHYQSGDTIRIVKIGDYDSCPCIGNHVKSTAEIGQFEIISTSFENGVLRIRFRLKEKYY
jgi:misacylated tRNA(Ala) deacylase